MGRRRSNRNFAVCEDMHRKSRWKPKDSEHRSNMHKRFVILQIVVGCKIDLYNCVGQFQLSLSWWPAPSAWVPPNLSWVTLDCTLSYREHLKKTAGKLKNRNDLLMKLAGSTCGASTSTLRSSALALCYSSSLSSCGLSYGGRCRSYELAPCLPILSSVIGSCQTNVQGRQVRFNGP